MLELLSNMFLEIFVIDHQYSEIVVLTRCNMINKINKYLYLIVIILQLSKELKLSLMISNKNKA